VRRKAGRRLHAVRHAERTDPQFCKKCGRPLLVAPEGRSERTLFVSPESYTPKHLAEKILTSRSALERVVAICREKKFAGQLMLEASIGILGDALSMLFTRVQCVAQRPPLGAEGAGIVGVLEPQIEHFRYEGPSSKRRSYAGLVAYRFILYAADGTRLGSWIVTGEAEKKIGAFAISSPRGGPRLEAVQAAMEDVVGKFALGFHEVPEVRKWLRDSGVEPPKAGR